MHMRLLRSSAQFNNKSACSDLLSSPNFLSMMAANSVVGALKEIKCQSKNPLR